MKRLRHWLFNTLAATSLLICLPTAIIWVRSYWITDSFFWNAGAIEPVTYQDQYSIICSCGGIRITHTHEEFFMLFRLLNTDHRFRHFAYPQSAYPYFWRDVMPGTYIRFKGFQFFRYHGRDQYTRFSIQRMTFPLAVIFLPSLLLLALWTRRQLKRSRLSKGNFCPTCGYDLRATPDRCPECGTTVPAKLV